MKRPIKIVLEYPPIPVRDFDYLAYYEGEEEAGHYGHGATPQAALDDFIENCAEYHNERLGLGGPS